MKYVCVLLTSLCCCWASASGVRVKAEREEPGAVITAWGSGCFVGRRQVLTAYHVVDRGYITVELAGEWRKCRVVRFDHKLDLALLECVAESDDVVKLAQGEPLYVSASDKSAPIQNREVSRQSGWVNGHIDHGNSGGPVLNAKGELVGIVRGTNADGGQGEYLDVTQIKAFLGEQK